MVSDSVPHITAGEAGEGGSRWSFAEDSVARKRKSSGAV